MNEVQVINGAIEPGDWVIAKPDDDYGCLVGQVLYIEKLGTPEHESENLTDDVHVNFMAVEYSKHMKAQILEAFDNLGSTAIHFEDLPLDDAIMAPESLISVDFSSNDLHILTESYEKAEVYCNAVIAAQNCGDKLTALKERLDKNLSDYADGFIKLDTPLMLRKARELANTNDMYAYMNERHEYSEPELDYLLLFQDPLRVATDAWLEMGKGDVAYGFYHAVDAHKAIVEDYALAGGAVSMASVETQDSVEQPLSPVAQVSGEEIGDVGTMPEMLRKLMMFELAKSGFPQAEYAPETGMIKIPVDGFERPILITEEGYVRYMPEVSDLADSLKPIAEQVREMAYAWEYSRAMPVGDLPEFRLLAECNSIVLAARDDSVHGRGLHFVTWEYNYERTGMYRGHYTEDYIYAKEDFAVRAGLVPENKLFTPEQAVEVKTSIDYRIKKDNKLTLAAEDMLKDVAGKLDHAYPSQSDLKKDPPGKKPSIGDRLRAGKEKPDATKANNPAPTAKKRTKEID